MHIHSPYKPKMVKQTSARKLMATVFWDWNGVPVVEFMQQETTITSQVYCKIYILRIKTVNHNKCITFNVY
jgi:hypothetical protein